MSRLYGHPVYIGSVYTSTAQMAREAASALDEITNHQ